MPLILAFLAQAGAMVTPGAAPPLPHEKGVEVVRPPRHSQTPAPGQSDEARSCNSQAENAPSQAEGIAKAWLAKAQGAEKALAGECLGIALSRQAKWDEAQAAFITARDGAADKAIRARLGAMAGNAALARGDAASALAVLASAQADAGADKAMSSGIAADRARALVALKRDGEAAMALDESRSADPGNAQAWLLSATLSRRMNKLGEAQTQIEKAAALAPADPEIGLEAGVIAVLSGHDEAARKSWQSVITAAPDSDEAATAKGYLTQLGAAPARTARP
jgi:tetratricopeptide (TPR) repeat protein